MNIQYTSTPDSADIDFLTQKINAETPDFGSAFPFAFFVRDDNQQIIAGCNGSVVYGAIHTDQLWVDLPYRQTGLGLKLMEAVHKLGIEHGCQMATADTMSFQVDQNFYEKLGYVVDFERKGYIEGTTCLFLRKNLLSIP